jgi:hypothetical protein
MAFKPIPFEIYRQGTAPEPPETLGVLGSNLWRQIVTENDIPDTARLTILEQACAMLDRTENLRRQIAVEGELIETHTGGIKANPLLMCELQARALVARLLGKLNLSNEPKRGPGRPPNSKPGHY